MASIYKTTKKINGHMAKAERWTIAFKDPYTGRRRKVTRFKDYTAAKQYAASIERKIERAETGLIDPFEEHRRIPLGEHIEVFRDSLEARALTPKYIKLSVQRLETAVEFIRASRLNDLNNESAERFLLHLIHQGRNAKTRNHYIAILKEFGGWLVESGRMAVNPFIRLSKSNVESDRRKVRRPYTSEELALLIDAARRRPLEEGLKVAPNAKAETITKWKQLGEERARIYEFVAFTGLRKNEVRTLCWGHVDFESARPTITVHAVNSKSRRTECVPLRKSLAHMLREWYKITTIRLGRFPGPNDRIFKVPLHITERILYKDLKFAGIPLRNEAGRVADFHALRHTFASALAKAKVTLHVAQVLMRHADSRTTQQIYTHVESVDLTLGVEAIPAPPLHDSDDVTRSAGA